MPDLEKKRCVPCEGGVPKLAPVDAQRLLGELDGWTLAPGEAEISRVFNFTDYYETMAFVNAVAWIAHTEDHHPDMLVRYDHVTVSYSTHAVGGLTENDFICAAKVDALIGERRG